MLSRVLATGFIVKKDGWIVSLCKKPSDRLPTVSVKRTARRDLEDEASTTRKTFTLVNSTLYG
ncbi:MAG: hypothetical protein ACTSXC_04785 [Candidatus Freyarchaeota archaeon]